MSANIGIAAKAKDPNNPISAPEGWPARRRAKLTIKTALKMWPSKMAAGDFFRIDSSAPPRNEKRAMTREVFVGRESRDCWIVPVRTYAIVAVVRKRAVARAPAFDRN